MSVLSLGKWPGSVVRPLRAGNLCQPARRPEAGVRTPVAGPPPAAGRPRAPRLDQTEFTEWPGRAGRTAAGRAASQRTASARTAPASTASARAPLERPAQPRRAGRVAQSGRAGRPERILRLVQPGETAQSQSLPAAPSRRQPPRQAPPPVRVPPPRQAPPIEQASPSGPGIRPARRRPMPPGSTYLAAQPGWSGETARAGGAAWPGQAVQPRQAARARPRTRLTRRGRRVVWTFATLLLIAVLTPVLLVASAGAQAANHGASPAQVRAGMQHVVVQPGQSLWSIAVQAEPQADPRTVIQQIIEYNALGSDVVAPGESLWVPKG
jgi:LysM domain